MTAVAFFFWACCNISYKIYAYLGISLKESETCFKVIGGGSADNQQGSNTLLPRNFILLPLYLHKIMVFFYTSGAIFVTLYL